MTNRHHAIIALAATLVCMLASSASAQVDARIERVGLFAGADPIVRSGQWCMVQVWVRYRGAQPFDVELRLDQTDRDGDVVTSITPFPLTPNSEWESHELYFVPHDVNRNSEAHVRLFDDKGELLHVTNEAGEDVTELVSRPYRDWPPPEEFLVVDLSTTRRLPHVLWLDSELRREAGFLNARTVRAMSPKELPSRWEGLESVDAMVWDDADPSGLTSDQIGALAGWVQAGGKLLITAGANWQRLAGSDMANLLPVRITDVEETNELGTFLEIVRNEDYRDWLKDRYQGKPVQRCVTSLKKLAIPIPGQCSGTPIAYRHQIGRGSLTFVGAAIADLLPAPRSVQTDDGSLAELDDSVPQIAHFRDFGSEQVVGRTFLGLAPVHAREQYGMLARDPTDLYQKTRDTIAFGSLSAAFIVFAVIFAITYTIAAAGVTYWYLKRRGWLHHCWTAFAVVSIAGSVVGTGMVWTLRGFRMKLWQTTVVDARAGETDGVATCLFGVKTPKHTRLNLRLPIQERIDDDEQQHCGALRSMPENTDPFARQSVFVAPERYESVFLPNTMALNDVKVRATLKEFQGTWNGPIGGLLDAKLYRGADNDFAGKSYISNRLNIPLRDCYLFATRSDFAERGSVVQCFRLGDMPSTGEASTLAGETLTRRLYINPQTGTAYVSVDQMLPKLLEAWMDRVRSIAPTAGSAGQRDLSSTGSTDYYSMLLLSFFGLLEPTGQNKTIGLTRSHARSIDCSHLLTQDTALLIGYVVDQPPPAILQVDSEDLEPERALTIYRFVIPVERSP